MRPGFDPLQLFPSRVATTEIPVECVRESPVGGATGYDETGKVVQVQVPVKNTAYARTVRRHEALHCIYSKPSPGEDSSKLIMQAIEDARMHLVCSRAEGMVRRDEIATAITDLRARCFDKALLPLLVLRAAAILKAQDDTSKTAHSLLRKKAELVHSEYMPAMERALSAIKRGEYGEAKAELTPYFTDARRDQTFPSAGKSEDGIEKDETGFDAPVQTVEQDTDLEKEAQSLIAGEGELSDYDKTVIGTVHLNIHNLAAYDNIPTFFGASEKMVPSGKRIKAKKLATIVGPGCHRIFTKTIKRKGGTVLIDASGSMNFTADELLQVIAAAPLATIAFYNAPDDKVRTGNLWIFSDKAKRAADLSLVKTESKYAHDPERWGCGNVVDLQAMRWLLKQPGPRYYVTDGEFTGPTTDLAKTMFNNALSRKLFTPVWAAERSDAKCSDGTILKGRGKRDHLAKLREIIEKRG
jgi:hypothetical protein